MRPGVDDVADVGLDRTAVAGEEVAVVAACHALAPGGRGGPLVFAAGPVGLRQLRRLALGARRGRRGAAPLGLGVAPLGGGAALATHPDGVGRRLRRSGLGLGLGTAQEPHRPQLTGDDTANAHVVAGSCGIVSTSCTSRSSSTPSGPGWMRRRRPRRSRRAGTPPRPTHGSACSRQTEIGADVEPRRHGRRALRLAGPARLAGHGGGGRRRRNAGCRAWSWPGR